MNPGKWATPWYCAQAHVCIHADSSVSSHSPSLASGYAKVSMIQMYGFYFMCSCSLFHRRTPVSSQTIPPLCLAPAYNRGHNQLLFFLGFLRACCACTYICLRTAQESVAR